MYVCRSLLVNPFGGRRNTSSADSSAWVRWSANRSPGMRMPLVVVRVPVMAARASVESTCAIPNHPYRLVRVVRVARGGFAGIPDQPQRPVDRRRAADCDLLQGHRADSSAQLPELPPARTRWRRCRCSTYEDARPYAAAIKRRTASAAGKARCRRGTSRRASASSTTRTTSP